MYVLDHTDGQLVEEQFPFYFLGLISCNLCLQATAERPSNSPRNTGAKSETTSTHQPRVFAVDVASGPQGK